MHLALSVANLGLGDPGHALVRELHAPEAASAEAGKLVPSRGLVIIRPLRNGDVGGVKLARAARAEPQHAQKPIHGACLVPRLFGTDQAQLEAAVDEGGAELGRASGGGRDGVRGRQEQRVGGCCCERYGPGHGCHLAKH